MLQKLSAADKINMLADNIEQHPEVYFDMTCWAHCAYGWALRIFAEEEKTPHSDHLADMTGLTREEAHFVYHRTTAYRSEIVTILRGFALKHA